MQWSLSGIAAITFLAGDAIACAEEPAQDIPPMRREFRAAWVATVANIDWPSRRGLSTDEQKAEMISLLDTAAKIRLNAIVLQVRPSCDAIYDSRIEPWSEYLTGEMGRQPEPFYDPLEFAVREAHARGIELHAWFNPYRALHAEAQGNPSKDHVSQTQPEVVKRYGKYLWLDPGELEATKHTVSVILDVVRRYDIDGVHLDDYFYPYPITEEVGDENSEEKRKVPFPDDASWQRAQSEAKTSGHSLGSRDDWRRQNVNQLVKQLYREIKQAKPWVKFGISPFGIGRPGHPQQIKGFDQRKEIYADAQLWLNEGWVDYFTPQLYWAIDPPEQSYSALLGWWHQENRYQRHLWPGNYTSRLGQAGKKHWEAEEIVAQIWVTRAQQGATGNVHFSMKALLRNFEGIADKLADGPYREPALVPATPWLAEENAPKLPTPTPLLRRAGNDWTLVLEMISNERLPPWLWVVRTRHGDRWNPEILPGQTKGHRLPKHFDANGISIPASEVAVSRVDRLGREGPVVRLPIKSF